MILSVQPMEGHSRKEYGHSSLNHSERFNVQGTL